MSQYTAATIWRNGNPPIPVGAISPFTPVSMAEALVRALTGIAQAGDLVELRKEIYDMSAQTAALSFPAGVKIIGAGPGETILTSPWFVWDGLKRVAFQLGQGTSLEGMTLRQAESDVNDPGLDGICCGFSQPGLSATLKYMELFGREWVLYGWQPDCNLLCEDFTITGGRVCVASENSGDGQNFTFRRGVIVGDASLSLTGPNLDVANPRNGGVFGVVHRGGKLVMTDVDIQIKGLANLPRACAITDVGGDNSAPAGNTTYELFGVKSAVNANGAAQSFDLDVQTDYLQDVQHVREQDCWGAAKDGSLLRSW